MKYSCGKVVVVALGGSVIFPDGVNWRYLQRFKNFIKPWLGKKKFIIVAGGGQLARLFQAAAHKVGRLRNEDKDWLGIHATRLNAHLLRTIFRDVAEPVVIDKRHRLKKLKYPLTIASGWRPGWSTDYVAAVLAYDFGAKEFIVAGKPAYVYDKDPHPKNGKKVHAKPFRELTWARYRRMIPAKWIPGAHAPVDPVAARFAAKRNLKAVILNGKDLRNLEALLNNKNFKGTIIG